MRYGKAGVLNLIGNDFADGINHPGVIFDFFNPNTLGNSINIIGNIFPNNTPFNTAGAATANKRIIGNQWIDSGGRGEPLPDMINGPLQLQSLTMTPVVFSGLPSSPTEGMLIPITDSNTSTFGATITGGGGSNHGLAYYNGTNWTFR
jgi:hypothetical protein